MHVRAAGRVGARRRGRALLRERGEVACGGGERERAAEREDNMSAWRARRESERAARSRARAVRAWRALSAGTARGARNDLAGRTSPPERLELSTTPESHRGLGDPATQRRNLGPCGGSVASAASPCVGRTCATRSARHTAADSAPNDASARRRPRQHHLATSSATVARVGRSTMPAVAQDTSRGAEPNGLGSASRTLATRRSIALSR